LYISIHSIYRDLKYGFYKGYTNYPLIDLEMSDHWHIGHINLSSELFKLKLIVEDEDDMFEAIHNKVDKMVKFPFHTVPDVNL